MNEEDFKESVKLKLSTLDDQTELLSEVLQNTKDDIAENEDKVTDVVERVEFIQKQVNDLKEDWRDYKDNMDEELASQKEADINSIHSMDQKIKTIIKNQKSLRQTIQIVVQNQSMLANILEEEHGQIKQVEAVRSTNQALYQKLNGDNREE